MNRISITGLVLVAAAPLLFTVDVLRGANDDCVNCEVECTRCGEEFCYPVPKEITVSKHCWEIECKQVCIPTVRFPWERWFGGGCDGCDDASCDDCCKPRCGKVRWVRVLKKRKYDRKKMGCDWIVNPICDGCLSTLPDDYDPRTEPDTGKSILPPGVDQPQLDPPDAPAPMSSPIPLDVPRTTFRASLLR